MAVGNVKWFDEERGFGFIQPEDGSKDVFVDLKALKGAGLDELREGMKVEYKLVEGRNGRTAAGQLLVVTSS